MVTVTQQTRLGDGLKSGQQTTTSANNRFLLWLGFGLFIVTYGGGPLGFVSGSANQVVDWGAMLLATTVFMVGTALGCLLVARFRMSGLKQQQQWFGAAAYVGVTLLCLVLQPVLSTADAEASLIVRNLLSLLVGVFYGQPLLFWVSCYSKLSLSCTRFVFLSLLLSCYLIDPIAIALAGFMDGVPFIYSIGMVLCAVISAGLQLVLSRSSSTLESTPEPGQQQPKSYRLTVYSATVLVCLGFSWGIAESSSLYAFSESIPNDLWVSLLGAFGVLFINALAAQMLRSQNGMRFGSFIRLTVVGCGIAVASLPLLYAVAPVFLYVPCYFVMVICEISVLVFSIDLAREEGKSLISVYSINYAMLIGAVCLSDVFFWLAHTLAEGMVAWLVVTMVATWVVLGVIPFLPSRSSTAAVLSLDKLPENEGFEAHVALQRESMVSRYGLSEGEAEVLQYLLMGMKRDEIAEKMYLSPWTIKARTSAIYKKCGIHSYKELMVLVSGSGD